ncbi:MAG: VanZ family protein, partial [Pseudonocardia sp.]
MDRTSTRPADRAGLTIALLASLAVVALLTLTPDGHGWAWGSPLTEAHWYLSGLDSTATMLQLTGNLSLLTVPAARAVLSWPALGRPRALAVVAFAVSAGIEVAQWALPLGRVVSPLDAVLNATGAIAAGLLTAHVQRMRDQSRVI